MGVAAATGRQARAGSLESPLECAITDPGTCAQDALFLLCLNFQGLLGFCFLY